MKPWMLLALIFFPIHPQDISSTEPCGLHAFLDIQNCDHDAIRNPPIIKYYVKTLYKGKVRT